MYLHINSHAKLWANVSHAVIVRHAGCFVFRSCASIWIRSVKSQGWPSWMTLSCAVCSLHATSCGFIRGSRGVRPCSRAGEGSGAEAGKGNVDMTRTWTGTQAGAGAGTQTGTGAGDGIEGVFVAHYQVLIDLPKGEWWRTGGLMKTEKGWSSRGRDAAQPRAHGGSC